MPEPSSSRARRIAAPDDVGSVATRRALFDGGHSDAVLVVRAREGDRWAQEVLFRRYMTPLAGRVTHIVGNVADADDVLQDTFADVLRDLARLREPEAFRGWLYRIAMNRARKVLRKRRLLRFLGIDGSVDDATLAIEATPATSPEVLAELTMLDEALRRVPADERIAWMLRHVHGEALEEIASWIGCSLATAKRRIAAAQARIDAHVAGRVR
ncbi:RNA polymerase sigma factor [Sandaracinus amylolyticus]|uniref:RNA polymerase sigma factor RpoE n=1 Tax=Sandaracinus amylolyticus TaxID=927083 RepID=A0A0F6SGM4_9BACT|nr:sigma-70 family RNA polymerase sigma factor [Sandaracinus amylolyticus]AKF08949.1 RNA polymerase sigma factor RpoE [Sandaracinus amylolyticus]